MNSVGFTRNWLVVYLSVVFDVFDVCTSLWWVKIEIVLFRVCNTWLPQPALADVLMAHGSIHASFWPMPSHVGALMVCTGCLCAKSGLPGSPPCLRPRKSLDRRFACTSPTSRCNPEAFLFDCWGAWLSSIVYQQIQQFVRSKNDKAAKWLIPDSC